MAAFADSSLTMDDVPFWQAGRTLAATFAPATVEAVIAGLDRLRQERPDLRTLIV